MDYEYYIKYHIFLNLDYVIMKIVYFVCLNFFHVIIVCKLSGFKNR